MQLRGRMPEHCREVWADVAAAVAAEGSTAAGPVLRGCCRHQQHLPKNWECFRT